MSLFSDLRSCHDFPRLARESGFSFNLYRGRVDWSKIGAIDVDRLIRERDLETLQDCALSIMSCSLDNEYDLKVLDPNFVKLFRLAQLCVDYYQYCRRYLDHCVTVMQDQLRVALSEIEQFQKNQQQKEDEIKQLQKKLRGKSKSSALPGSSPVPIFKCGNCSKVFIAEKYLTAHQVRRHPEISGPTVTCQNNEIETLHQKVLQLQERLLSTEEILKHYQASQVAGGDSGVKTNRDPVCEVTDTSVFQKESLVIKAAPQHGPDLVDGSKPPQNLKEKLDAEVQTSLDSLPNMMESLEKIKADYQADRTSLLNCVQQQNEEIKALRDQLLVQHQSNEIAFQKKLEEIHLQHQADLADLRLSMLNPPPVTIAVSSLQALHHQSIIVSPQDTPMKAKSWDKQKLVDVESESVKSKHFQRKSDVSPSVSENFNARSTGNSHQIHPENLEKKFNATAPKSTSLDSLFSDQDSSPTLSSSASLDMKEASKIENLGNEIVKLPLKHGPDLKGYDNSSAPKVINVADERYREPTSSTSSESASGSGTSSCESDCNATPVVVDLPANVKDLQHLSKTDLNPEVLDGLKEDLQILVDKRLRELGVDPEWDGLPAASFRSNLATVKHHQNIAARTHKSYFKIKDAIIREVDKHVAQNSKHQSPTSSLEKKKSQGGSSLSLLARLKSSVKNKLSPSGRSLHFMRGSSLRAKDKSSNTKIEDNHYSSEPCSSTKPDTCHEYETLLLKNTTQTEVGSEDEKSSHSSNVVQVDFENTVSLGTSVLSDTKAIDLSPSPKKPYAKEVKSFGRSMYANLDGSEITLDKVDSPSSDSFSLQNKSPHTSTPIKAIASSETREIPFKEPNPMFTSISSDTESISEMESDVNSSPKVIEEELKVFPPSSLPRVGRSTAELLADVAKLRQKSDQHSIVRPIFKSNLKSSASTGSIMKKKVVFRDEKDGFNTIELGPALGRSSPVAPQRSHSDSDLSVSLSFDAPITRPVPLPRGSFASTPTTVQTAHGTLKQSASRPTPEKWKYVSGRETDSSRSILANQGKTFPEENPESGNSNRVSDLVKDIEQKLDQSKKKPFGLSESMPHSPATLSTPDIKAKVEGSKSVAPSAINIGKEKSSLDDLISELLLDDISSS